MTVRIELKGSEAMQAALAKASADVREAAGKAVLATAVELRSDVVKSIAKGPASGRVYQKNNPRRVHQASAPGQPPMTDTGRLVNSITFDRAGPLTATVGSNVIYALYLEYGTRRMAARPFMRPAAERIKPKFLAALEAAISGAMR